MGIVRSVSAGGTTALADRDRAAELEVKPLLSPNASSHEGRLDGEAFELLSGVPEVELGSPPGRLADIGREVRGSASGADASISRTLGSVGGAFPVGTSSASSMMTDGTLTNRSPAGTRVRGFGIIPSPPFPCARPDADWLEDEGVVEERSSASSSRISFLNVFFAPSTARSGPP